MQVISSLFFHLTLSLNLDFSKHVLLSYSAVLLCLERIAYTKKERVLVIETLFILRYG